MKNCNPIYYTLRELRVPAYIRGYKYIHDALSYLSQVDEPAEVNLTRHIYPYIAHQNKVTPGAIDRGIRVAVAMAWKMMPNEIRREYGFYNQLGEPSVREFIFTTFRHMQNAEIET